MEELRKKFEGHIKENEHIVWCGRPKQGILIRDVDLIAIPMSLILFGFSIVLNYAIYNYYPGISFMFLGFMLSFVCVYAGIIRFFRNSWHRKYLFYCITTKRVLVIKGKKKEKLSTLPLKNIESLEITTEKDLSGFITFGTVNPVWPWLLGGFYFTSENIPGIELVPNVGQVYDILVQQLESNVDPEVLIRLYPGKDNAN